MPDPEKRERDRKMHQRVENSNIIVYWNWSHIKEESTTIAKTILKAIMINHFLTGTYKQIQEAYYMSHRISTKNTMRRHTTVRVLNTKELIIKAVSVERYIFFRR